MELTVLKLADRVNRKGPNGARLSRDTVCGSACVHVPSSDRSLHDAPQLAAKISGDGCEERADQR